MAIPLLALVAPLLVGQVVGAMSQMFANPLGIVANRLFPIFPPPIQTAIAMRQRDIIDEPTYLSMARDGGYDNDQAERFWQVGKFYPTPSDLISWQAREVYEPDAIEKYGLDDEFENISLEPFRKAGIDDEQSRNFWRAHWQHPSFTQISGMLFRDTLYDPEGRDKVPVRTPEWKQERELAEREVDEWFRLVEIPPHWRARMRSIAQLPYTRVDIRRMWDLGVATDDDVVRAYLDQGYDAEHAELLLAFAKVERRLPDLLRQYRNGWIGLADIVTFLEDIPLPKANIDIFIQSNVVNLERPNRVANERDLTKSEIVKGVKKGVISEDDGVDLLVTMGYDLNEAVYIMRINIESEGSPEDYADLLDLIRKDARARGKDIPDSPPHLREVAAAHELARQALAVGRAEGRDLDRIAFLEEELRRAKVSFDSVKAGMGLPLRV